MDLYEALIPLINAITSDNRICNGWTPCIGVPEEQMSDCLFSLSFNIYSKCIQSWQPILFKDWLDLTKCACAHDMSNRLTQSALEMGPSHCLNGHLGQDLGFGGFALP